ncbi:MAG: hypothetical protein JST54_18020 [Deltaproteobacteria bacterium]|nr:hypothetical protein [Deltaproteobacteria bacterium]
MSLAQPNHAWLEALRVQRERRARALAGWQAGIRKSVDLPGLASRAPALGTPEPFLAARDANALPLALALARELGDVAAARAESRALEALAGGQVSVELELLALPEALRELPICVDRRRRALLAKAVDDALRAIEHHQAEALERRLESRTRLELSSENALNPLLGFELGALAADAERILRETNDAAHDLLEFRFRRAGVDAGRGGAGHDFELALQLLDLREHLSPHRSLELARELARGVGLDPRGIAVDAEARPGRVPGLVVARFGANELAVVAAPLGTPADGETLARGVGEAIHLALLDGDDAVLIDPSLAKSTGWILARPLVEPAWHRRVLRNPSRPAHELAQAFALRSLFALRLAAARFLVARELANQGPTESAKDHARSRINSATGVDGPATGCFALDVIDCASELRALLLSERLHRALIEHADEDWWRNPHASELLRAHASETSLNRDSIVGSAPELAKLLSGFIARAAN